MTMNMKRALTIFPILLVLVAAPATVVGQVTVCVDGPDNRLGFPSLVGGNNSFGGYSLTADGLEIFYAVWTNQPGPNQPVGVAGENDWMLRWDSWIVRATRESVDVTFKGEAILKAPVNEDDAPRKAYGPRISADDKLLYFSAAFRSGGAGWWDIWVAERDDPEAPEFGRVERLPNVNAGGADIMGCVSPDGTELFFARSPSGVELRLWRARFKEPHKPLAGFTDARRDLSPQLPIQSECSTGRAVCRMRTGSDSGPADL